MKFLSEVTSVWPKLTRHSGIAASEIGMTKSTTTTERRDIVQVKNPRTGHYVKIDRAEGRILAHKKSEGPYKGLPVARKRK